MKRVRYEPQVKAAIHSAVLEARKSGKKWSEALEVAKQAGYKGTEGGLMQFMTPSKPATKVKASKPVKVKVSAPAKVKGKPGRKPKVQATASAPIVSAPVSAGPLDITALVHKTVTDAVVSALEGLLATLKKS